jgi:hypothetical protein
VSGIEIEMRRHGKHGVAQRIMIARRRALSGAGAHNRAHRNRVVVPGEGPPCPRCGEPMQIREHRKITADLLAKPYYFSRWFRCMQRGCKTKLVMPEKFKVLATKKDGLPP